VQFDIEIARRFTDARVSTAFKSDRGLTALFGPSGAGKTSILNMVAGLLKPDMGRIAINDTLLFDHKTSVNLSPKDRRAGYVFQDGRLFPHMKVRDNLLYGWKIATPEERNMTLEEATGFLGISHLLDRWPRTLSGGEAQRVAIGRALLSVPRFLLMDEPLASLDRARREEIMIVIERLRDELKLPILYVSHDRAEVERLATTIIEI
jgi:molybdate transport system ATP-binding protein